VAAPLRRRGGRCDARPRGASAEQRWWGRPPRDRHGLCGGERHGRRCRRDGAGASAAARHDRYVTVVRGRAPSIFRTCPRFRAGSVTRIGTISCHMSRSSAGPLEAAASMVTTDRSSACMMGAQATQSNRARAHVPARDAIGWSSHPGARPSVQLRFVRMSSPAVSPFHRSICPRPSRRTTVRIVGGIVGEVRVAEAKWGFAATGATSALRSPRGDARLVELRNGSCVGLSLWQALAGARGRYVVLVAHRSSGVSVVRAGGPWIVA